MKKLLLVYLFIVCSSPDKAQDLRLVDSLYNQIKITKNDSVKIDLLNQIALHFLFTNTTGTFQPAKEAFLLSEKMNYKKGAMDAINRLGVMHYRLSNFDSSIYYLNKGLEIAQQNKDSIFSFKFLKNIALSLVGKGDYQKALEFYYKQLKTLPPTDTLNQAKTIMDIGQVYYYLSDFDKAYNMTNKAYNLARYLPDLQLKSNALCTLGVIEYNRKKPEKALEYYKQGLVLCKIAGDKLLEINTLINISNIYFDNKEYRSSIKMLDSAIELAKQSNIKDKLAIAYLNKGNSLENVGEMNKAIQTQEEALKIFKEIGARNKALDCYLNLAGKYKAIGKYKNASNYYREALYLKDTVFNSEMNANIAQMRIKFETEQKELENQRLLKENELQALKIDLVQALKRNVFLVLIAVVIIFVLAFLRYKLIKRTEFEKKLADEKQFRLMEVIAVEEKERSRIARELHDGLGQILSTIRINSAGLEDSIVLEDKHLLDHTLTLIDRSVSEVRQISHNLMPVSLERYGLIAAIQEIAREINQSGKISVSVDYSGEDVRFSANLEHSVYRIVQEIINNILKHAGASYIAISMVIEKSFFLIDLDNDGKTLEVSSINKTSGIGWKNIFNRISILNAKIEINPGKASGTTIKIQIPVEACVIQ